MEEVESAGGAKDRGDVPATSRLLGRPSVDLILVLVLTEFSKTAFSIGCKTRPARAATRTSTPQHATTRHNTPQHATTRHNTPHNQPQHVPPCMGRTVPSCSLLSILADFRASVSSRPPSLTFALRTSGSEKRAHFNQALPACILCSTRFLGRFYFGVWPRFSYLCGRALSYLVVGGERSAGRRGPPLRRVVVCFP